MSDRYTFTADQLTALIHGAIELYLEYRDQHGKEDEDARRAAVAEVFEGLDSEAGLLADGITDRPALQTFESGELYRAAVGALLWLDNLAQRVGEDTLLDALPNNCGGRFWLREAIRKATGDETPALADDSDLAAAAGLLLRTVHDTLRHADLTDAQRDNLAAAAAPVRAALRGA